MKIGEDLLFQGKFDATLEHCQNGAVLFGKSSEILKTILFSKTSTLNNMQKHRIQTSILLLIFLFGSAFVLEKGPFKKKRNWPRHSVDKQMVKAAENFFNVNISPAARYSYAIMRPGVLQHLDRRYTYDVIPKELMEGVLYQGLHRPPTGTKITIRVEQQTDVYFFFHHTVDGGYGKIFPELKGWTKMPVAPQYDIKSRRGHGLKMIMYHLEAEPGVNYRIPATTADRACFNIVFQTIP